MIGVMVPSAFAYTITDDATGGDCSTIGTWDSASRTCTLTSDISESIVIASNYVTLDGNGNSILGPNNNPGEDKNASGSGISLNAKTNVVIKNVIVKEFTRGITVADSVNNQIINNSFINNWNSQIFISNSNNNIISGNIVTGQQNNYGIFDNGNNNQILSNTLSLNEVGISTQNSDSVIISNNIVQDSSNGGIVGGADSTINGNTVTNSVNGIVIEWATDVSNINNNNISNNEIGLMLGGTNLVAFENNISDNELGLLLMKHNTVFHNNLISNTVEANMNQGYIAELRPSSNSFGNYWSDYSPNCTDSNFDNLCDEPYPFRETLKVSDENIWTVQDGWLTTINVPAATTVNAVDMSGINHIYSVSANHDGSSMSVTCDMASGSLFPIGVNEVLCTANNGIKSTFTVTVEPPLPIIHPSSPCDDGCTHEGNNPDLKIFASGYVDFPVDGVSTISSVWKDPAGVVVYDEILQVNAQSQFNNEFDNPMYIRDMRDSGLYTATYTYDGIVSEYTWNYLTSVYVPQPDDGSFTLPCSMQEKGDGVSTSSCNGIYESSVARAEVGINYHTGILPIENYKAVGFFIDEDGNQGDSITVTLGLISPDESKTLVFENTAEGFVSEFQMQMLGGTLVEPEPQQPEPEPQPEADTVAPQVLVPENIVVNSDVTTGEIVTFNPTAVDNVDELLTPTCSPQSGSLFPVGVTTVICTAIDAAGNANTNSFTVTIDYKEFEIPEWVKNVASFWYADDIDDASFLTGIQYLIQNDVIVVPITESGTEGGGTVPAWVKNNAGWWAQGAITDADFVNGIQFLIKDGLIQVS